MTRERNHYALAKRTPDRNDGSHFLLTTSGRLRILVVEDNPVNQLFAVRTLEKRGHHTTVAGNGEEALRLLANCAFDVVLMDVQMPVMDGYQATARIRQAEVGTNRHQPRQRVGPCRSHLEQVSV